MVGGFGVKLDAYENEKKVLLLVLHENAPRIMQIMSIPVPEGASGLSITVLDLPSYLTGITVSAWLQPVAPRKREPNVNQIDHNKGEPDLNPAPLFAFYYQ